MVYWTNQLGGAVMSAPLAGGSPTVFATAVSPALLAIDTDTVYWTDGSGGLWEQKKVGGSAALIYPSGITSLAVSASYVYATSSSTINLLPKAAGSPITVPCPGNLVVGYFPSCSPQVLGVDGTTVYVTGVYDNQDLIGPYDFVFDEADPTTIFNFGVAVLGMAFDPGWHYGSEMLCNAGPCLYGIWKSPTCPGPALLLASQPQSTFLDLDAKPTGLVTDGGPWVYWTDGARIGRASK
jgi:hypothetical protein